MSTSWTVEQLNSDLFVDKTFEWSNLLTWNIVYRAVITRGIQWQNTFHRTTNRNTRFTVFTKSILLQSSPLPQDVAKWTKVQFQWTQAEFYSYANRTQLLFEKEQPLNFLAAICNVNTGAPEASSKCSHQNNCQFVLRMTTAFCIPLDQTTLKSTPGTEHLKAELVGFHKIHIQYSTSWVPVISLLW